MVYGVLIGGRLNGENSLGGGGGILDCGPLDEENFLGGGGGIVEGWKSGQGFMGGGGFFGEGEPGTPVSSSAGPPVKG